MGGRRVKQEGAGGSRREHGGPSDGIARNGSARGLRLLLYFCTTVPSDSIARFFPGLSSVLPWSFLGSSLVFPRFFPGLSSVLPWSFPGLPWSFPGLSSVLPRSFLGSSFSFSFPFTSSGIRNRCGSGGIPSCRSIPSSAG